MSSPLRIATPIVEAPAAGDVDPPRPSTTGPMAPALLLTADDLARELAVSVKTIRRLDGMGKLPRALKIGNHAKRWPRAVIVDWLGAGCPPRAEWEAFYAAMPRARKR
ncbi:MAG TPA: helix-turn-helix domain-containing protein [Pirellulales bacterium]|nr:helix-turn-helix domain-containing protein [Pirellulales bacterium]